MLQIHEGFSDLSEVTSGNLITPIGSDGIASENDGIVHPLKNKSSQAVSNILYRAWDGGTLYKEASGRLYKGKLENDGLDLTLLPVASRGYGEYRPERTWAENMLLRAKLWLDRQAENGETVTSLNIPIFGNDIQQFSSMPRINTNEEFTREELLQIAQEIFGDSDPLVNLLLIDSLESALSSPAPEDSNFFDLTLDS